MKRFCQLPADITFNVVKDLKLQDLSNLCLTEQKCQSCSDDKFWRRKLQYDYPTIKRDTYQNLTSLELYQQLTRRYGKLKKIIYNFKDWNIDFDLTLEEEDCDNYVVLKTIGDDRLGNLYVIDTEHNLRLLKYNANEQTEFDQILKVMFNYQPAKHLISLSGVKDVVVDGGVLILTTKHQLFQLKEVPGNIPNVVTKKILPVANNIREIGGDLHYLYYITDINDLFVQDWEQETPFEYIENVKSVSLDWNKLWYLTATSKLYKIDNGKKLYVTTLNQDVKQIILKVGGLYVLDTNKVINILSRTNYEVIKSFFGYHYMFTDNNVLNPVFALTDDLELYKFYKNELHFVASNVLSMSGINYVIYLPQTKSH